MFAKSIQIVQITRVVKFIIPCCASLLALALGPTPLHAADSEHPSANFQVTDASAVPGHPLAPGTYSVEVVDHLSDRYILKVKDANGGNPGLFIGIPNKALPAGSKGEVLWNTPAGGTTYLRGWQFPALPGLEFAYPKNDAVAIAKANGVQVPAIDPESEGMVSNTTLSANEMHIITLWLLTPTRVGPSSPAGIAAVRYSQVASVAHKPARLPHTASELPWFVLLGTLSLAGAAGLRAAGHSAERRS